jgi:hypothetical protein
VVKDKSLLSATSQAGRACWIAWTGTEVGGGWQRCACFEAERALGERGASKHIRGYSTATDKTSVLSFPLSDQTWRRI